MIKISNMIIKLKVFFLTLLTFLLLAAPQSAFAIDCSKFSSDPDIISGKTLGVYHLECVYQKFIGVVAPLAGLVAFIFIAYGGIKYISAQGDQKAVASAKITITISIFGLAMVLIAYFIIDILTRFTGVDLRNFEIPKP